MPATYNALGHAVWKLRVDKNLSQERLAILAGVHRTYISNIERGRTNVSYKNIEKLADALGVSKGELMNLCDNPRGDLKGKSGKR